MMERVEWTPGWTEAEAWDYYAVGMEAAKRAVELDGKMDYLGEREYTVAAAAIKAVLTLAREHGL